MKKNNMPLVSVILPVYNGSNFLAESINSILHQTFDNFELIIINDGSTDKSEEIIRSFNDPRIIYIKNKKNLQIADTLNIGIEKSRGKYIARMDADDISYPTRLITQVTFLEKNKNIDLCGTWIERFGANQSSLITRYPISHDEIKVRLLFECPIAHPTVLAKRSFFEKNCYNRNWIPAEDYNLWADTIDQYRFHNIPIPLLKYRVHNTQTANSMADRQKTVSDKIKAELLNKLGIRASDNELELHCKLLSSQNITYTEDIKGWIDNIFIFHKNRNAMKFNIYCQLSRVAYLALKRRNSSMIMTSLHLNFRYLLGTLFWFIKYHLIIFLRKCIPI